MKQKKENGVMIKAGHACNEAELEELLDLMREIKEVNLSGEVFEMENVRYYIKKYESRRFLVATFYGQVVGYVYGVIESPICGCLYYLGVKQDFRREGIGKELVEKLISQFKNVGVQYIYALSTNQRMTDFASNLGFSEGEKMTYMKLNFSDMVKTDE